MATTSDHWRLLAAVDLSAPGGPGHALRLVEHLYTEDEDDGEGADEGADDGEEPDAAQSASPDGRDDGLRVALALLDRDLPAADRALVTDFCSDALLERYLELRAERDLDEAVRVRRAQTELTDPDRACAAQVNLASLLMTSWEWTGREERLDEARTALTAAAGHATTSDERAVVAGARGNLHSCLYDLRRDVEDLRESIDAYMVTAASDDPSLAAKGQSSLAAMYLERFRTVGGDGGDLVEAERLARAALADPTAPPSTWRYELLVCVLRERCAQDGDDSRLAEAWQLIAALLDAVGENPSARASLVGTAASVAHLRYLAHHDRAALDEAIDLTEEALGAQDHDPAPEPQARAILANEACLLLTERFTLDGVRRDVDRAVEVARRRLDDPLPRSIELGLRTNLAGALYRRYESYRQVGDLDRGIALMRWVTSRAPDAPEKADALNSLALLLDEKARLTGRDADFREALARLDEAIALTPNASSDRAGSLINKATVLMDRAASRPAEATGRGAGSVGAAGRGEVGGPAEGGTAGGVAEGGTGGGPAGRGTGAGPAGRGTGSTKSGLPAGSADPGVPAGPADPGLPAAGSVEHGRLLDELVALLDEAWRQAPEGSGVRARAAYLLGCRYAERAGLHAASASPSPDVSRPEPSLTAAEAADLRSAFERWNEAVGLDEPFVTIEAGQQLGNASFALREWDAAALGYRAALGAADELTARRDLVVDRQLARFQVQGVAAAAALAELRAGAAREAVLRLEEGTATLLARSLGQRAHRARFDDVVEAAGTLDGPLVYWAATLAGGFAVVVRPDGRTVARELAVTSAQVESRLTALRTAFARQVDKPDSVLEDWDGAVRDLLGWTWEAVVAPVADALDDFPTVGLVPVGRLASLPLAAAASSPATSLLFRTLPRLLPGSRAVRPRTPWPTAPGVVVGCDPGHGKRRLPYAEAEADLVAGCYTDVRRLSVPRADEPVPHEGGPRVLRARGTAHGPREAAPGVERWTEAFNGAEVAHVICHYDLDPDQPLDSVLRFGDGVRVADLLEQRLPGAPHLVLSACDTGLGGVRLPDEALGLGSALLAAGARSVVASLWPLDDELAAGFMGEYHRRLAAGVAPAEALAAVQRDAAGEQPAVVWPGLVHMG
ncbi:CHAT domain-containing protein [Streptomyces heilongjiangensis]|uniref:CHAT domain-containing protein n=1 Tax=Streptomyces heilongjiangensis TaxID=945052 RepID=A0ABW1BJH9_9ACTN|nr:CHAT domain-containing tetratricopeptide repeat protein [Streptomyces heilongjiangensis]MDC2952406.1 CHAT domain-containing tetratricopeptide repeat protein [Streptomyces heilongjiangensis]